MIEQGPKPGPVDGGRAAKILFGYLLLMLGGFGTAGSAAALVADYNPLELVLFDEAHEKWTALYSVVLILAGRSFLKKPEYDTDSI